MIYPDKEPWKKPTPQPWYPNIYPGEPYQPTPVLPWSEHEPYIPSVKSKPERMKNDLLEIICILDRSGSMRHIAEDMKGGFDQFIADQKKNHVGRVKVSLYQFDDKYEEVFSNKDIDNVYSLKLVPRGWTALYDAIGKTINSVQERYSNTIRKEVPFQTLALILSDGQENSSKEFNSNQIKSLIQEAEKDNWRFVYLGANQDAILSARKMGISGASSADYAATAQGVNATWKNLSSNVIKGRKLSAEGIVSNYSFSTEQRESMLNPND